MWEPWELGGGREGPSEGRCHLSKRPASIEGQSCEVLWGSIPAGRRVLRQVGSTAEMGVKWAKRRVG